MSESIENGNSRGYAFQNLIMDMLEEIVSEYWWCIFSNQPKIQGQSNRWTPDIIINAENTFTLEDLNLAVIECKNVMQQVSSPVYWTRARAYMELNDLRLKRENQAMRFYLLVNRPPLKGEYPKFDYPQLFKSIGVELVHADNPRELASFEGKIHQLCGKSNPLQQINDIEQNEFEKISEEVVKRTIETIEKHNRELKIVIDRARAQLVHLSYLQFKILQRTT